MSESEAILSNDVTDFMQGYVLGKAIQRSFYPTINNEPYALPTQTPSIFVFADAPTLAQARAGTGAIGSAITSWTESSISPYGRTYTIPALADPDANSTATHWLFWEAINFKNELSGATQTVIRQFKVERASGNDSLPGTTVQDIKDVYPSISSYLDDAKLDRYLSLAQDQLKVDLLMKGYRWSRLGNLNMLRLALAYGAISLASIGQAQNGNDKHAYRYTEFSKMYKQALAAITLPVDRNGDGAPEIKAQARTYYTMVSR